MRRGLAACIATTLFVAAPATAIAAPTQDGVQAELASSGRVGRDLRAFYEARDYKPLWIRNGMFRAEARQLLEIFQSADLDGLDVGDYRPRAIAKAMDKAEQEGAPEDFARAEALLSQGLVDYVRDIRKPPKVGMVYLDRELLPAVPTARAVLDSAADAASLATYVRQMQWTNPLYVGLRNGLAAYREAGGGSRQEEKLIRLNMERARALPARLGRKHVVVDTLGGRLYMYENGEVKGSMRVIIGKPEEPTPMMAGLMRYAAVNPYWNIPPDLVRLRVAPKVLEQGASYIRSAGYQVLSDWSTNAKVVDPAIIDWDAVAAGRQELRVRQLPGPNNMMGRVKFMFPNDLGIYLHDTPLKSLFKESDRQFSSGCVRVENAERLSRWLFGRKITGSGRAEKRVDLTQPVPVYLTYFTAAPSANGIAFRDDVYGRDSVRRAKRAERLARL